MSPETLVTILCGLAIAVGVAGTIIPVLPGSILIGASLLAWAVWGGAGTARAGGFCGRHAVCGGRHGGQRRPDRAQAQEHAIPGRSIVAGLAAAVVGMFVIPVVGLFVGFAAGLLVSELLRTRHFRTAAAGSWAA